MTWVAAWALVVIAFTVWWARAHPPKTDREQAREDIEQMEYLRAWREEREAAARAARDRRQVNEEHA